MNWMQVRLRHLLRWWFRGVVEQGKSWIDYNSSARYICRGRMRSLVSYVCAQLNVGGVVLNLPLTITLKCKMFQNELYNFGSLYNFIQGTHIVLWTVIM
jgi:hypothetical protein